MTAKEYLSQAYRLDQQIKSKLDQLDMLRAMTQRVTACIRDDLVSHSRDVSAQEDAVIQLLDEEQELKREIASLVRLRRTIRKVISLVPDEIGRAILEKRFLCYQAYEKIAADLGMSLRWLHTLQVRAYVEVERILKEREIG